MKIPANRAGLPIPKKARIDTYPVVERYGYVFVFLGDLPESERPPMPRSPLLDRRGIARADGLPDHHRRVRLEGQLRAGAGERRRHGARTVRALRPLRQPRHAEIEDFDVEEIRASAAT